MCDLEVYKVVGSEEVKLKATEKAIGSVLVLFALVECRQFLGFQE